MEIRPLILLTGGSNSREATCTYLNFHVYQDQGKHQSKLLKDPAAYITYAALSKVPHLSIMERPSWRQRC